ncbi:MAG: protein arginine kinase [Candidatus Omnitrophica bacterium]|nr:protein arginine kinase [Candidatus Omnitrophota bacterium]
MIDNRILKQTSEWLKDTGPHSDIVISSRIRLARNFESFPFSHWAGKKKRKEVVDIAESAISELKALKGAMLLRMKEISDLDKQFLLERHLLSREMVADTDSKSVFISKTEVISTMINEEDHLRIQVMQSGLNLSEAWKIADALDDELSKKVDFAFDPNIGFLTSCPTNAGTGLRASVMLHLPALSMTNQINRVVQAISKLGLVVRGLNGEGTDAEGNLYQVSNQVTLGQSESETIDNLERIIKQLIGHEENARTQMMKQKKEMVNDKIFRALGTLRNAFIISSKETIELISMVRMGIDLGVITDVNRKCLNELFLLTQPAHLQRIEGRMLAQSDRDAKRADLIRATLSAKD